ncbi:uncharacterized protein METZ01_LOCUS357437 [marine metagenome]|uniref:Uncharacterized protein n=1 Tax=marine metagenome TaxID=408172 RepID=A0A382S404_9ZZZZ
MKNSKAFLNSFKTKYMVGIRPRIANCSHVDSVYVKAFGIQDALNRVDAAIEHLDWIVKDVIPAGDDLFGSDDRCCADGRAPVKDIGIATEFFGITFS